MNLLLETCNEDYKKGTLPQCAPLAVSFVPVQNGSTPQYDREEAVIRGTLFPGLDLPFKNIVNTRRLENTPLGELQAISFAITELNLYLNTHPNDKEALEMLNELIKLSNTAKMRYTEKYGPLNIRDLENSKSYTWLNEPWPWNYSESEG